MTDYDFDAAHRQARSNHQDLNGPGAQSPSSSASYAASGLLSNPASCNKCNGPARAEATLAMQGTHGNRAVQRSLQANTNPSSGGRVSVQRVSITNALPIIIDQARRAAAIGAAGSQPKEDKGGWWPDLPDWLNTGGSGGSGPSSEEGWFEGSGTKPTENTSPFPRPPTMPDSPTVQTDESTFPWLNPEWPAPEGDFPWLNPEWPIPQEGPPTSEQPSAFPWLNPTGCF